MADKLQDLVSQYLYWQKKKEKAEKELDSLKEEIIILAKKRKIKKIKSGKFQLFLVTQSETRFPQLGEPGRKEIEKIVRESGELKEAFTFDIVSLGNAYDQKKLSQELREKLKPFAKRVKTVKIVTKRKS